MTAFEVVGQDVEAHLVLTRFNAWVRNASSPRP
jgi:hypothetical protein